MKSTLSLLFSPGLSYAWRCLITGSLMSTVSVAFLLESQAEFTIVSIGDSVASGEGNPDIPQEFIPNPDYWPIRYFPNPNYSPGPERANPDYHPEKNEINMNYDPVEKVINPNFQPYPIPENLKELLPDFPAYDPNLEIPNPSFDPIRIQPDPFFDPRKMIPNDKLDKDRFSDIVDEAYDLQPFVEITKAVWDATYTDADAEHHHRSNRAGPALAAAVLSKRHPDTDLHFIHVAKSGARIIFPGEGENNPDETYANVIYQLDRAIERTENGRVDVLMMSVGANNLARGFSSILKSCLAQDSDGDESPDLSAPGCEDNDELNEKLEWDFETGLPRRFAYLAAEISKRDIGEVFITEYFDPTRGSRGNFCPPNKDMEWGYEEVVVPLNLAVRKAAQDYGWHYVGGIANAFRHHGYCASRVNDIRPIIPNPEFNPIVSIPNPDFNPVKGLPNPNFNPVKELPNRQYNPVQNIPNPNYDPIESYPNPDYNPVENLPNPHYDPVKTLPNPKYQPVKRLPNYNPNKTIPNPHYNPNKTIPNPHYDPNKTIPNPSYNPNPTIPNPDYDPNLTVPNPDYDPNPTIPNPAYDPEMLIPNPAYDPDLVIPNPHYEPVPIVEENWVVRIEESMMIQGDESGTAHPNALGHALYRDRLVEMIDPVIVADDSSSEDPSGESPVAPVDPNLSAPHQIAEIGFSGSELILTGRGFGKFDLGRVTIEVSSDLASQNWRVLDRVRSTFEDLGNGFIKARLPKLPGERMAFYRFVIME